MRFWPVLLGILSACQASPNCPDGSCDYGQWGAPMQIFNDDNAKSSAEGESPKGLGGTLPNSNSIAGQPALATAPQQTQTNNNMLKVSPKRVVKMRQYTDKEEMEAIPEKNQQSQSGPVVLPPVNPPNSPASQLGNTEIVLKSGSRYRSEGKVCNTCNPNKPPCECTPVHRYMKDFKWAKEQRCFNLESHINLMFKEERFWCRMMNIIKNAIENHLGERCTLCENERSEGKKEISKKEAPKAVDVKATLGSVRPQFPRMHE